MIPLKKERREREHMKKIEEIKQVIDTINFEKAESIVLNPVITPEKVSAFEKKYNISLPKEYVEFITKIGDGGVIQSEGYGEQKLISLEKYESQNYPLEKIDLPFPLEPNLPKKLYTCDL